MKLSVDLTRFESVSTTTEQKLIGGFSASFSSDTIDVGDEGSNNCLGGNCKMGCGIEQNIRCNTAAGCM